MKPGAFQKFLSFFLDKRFLIFIVIGLINTLNGVGLSYVLSLKFNANVSFVLGYLISLLIAYILNSVFNFKQKMTVAGFVRFFVSYIPNFLIQNLIVILVFNVLGLPKLIAYGAAAVLGIPVTFFFLKVFAFREKKDTAEKPLTRMFIESNLAVYAFALLFFALLLFAADWTLLLGENLMKWDIWNAHYPAQIIVSDAMSGGTFPLWNPLMRSGTPYYTIVGMPVFYPITLLLDYIGYTPLKAGLEYVIHGVLAGFGMFLLAGQQLRENRKKWDYTSLTISLAAGTVYCLSGLFLSNAEHIMIIISAAWIPYVLYFARSYTENGTFLSAMCAGACAGMILLGGYPEMFCNLFLVMIPYMLYFRYQSHREESFGKVFLYAALQYILICVFTVAASAVTALPFLSSMSKITRSADVGQVLTESNFFSLFSVLFNVRRTDATEISMSNYFMGILTVLTVPAVITGNFKHKKLYLGLSVLAFLMCMGSATFLHPLFYRFFPMYNIFRFPTLSRTFLTIFVLLMCVHVWKNFLEDNLDDKLPRFAKILFVASVSVGAACLVSVRLFSEYLENLAADAKVLSASLLLLAIVSGLYLIFFRLIKNRQLCGRVLKCTFLCLVAAEMLISSVSYLDVTVTLYKSNEYGYDVGTKDSVRREFALYDGRNTTCNFAGNARTTNGVNSKVIALHKTFDDEGYLSFMLKTSSEYRKTYHYSISAENPIVYFSSDIVTGDEAAYREWASAADVPAGQIFVKGAGGETGQKECRIVRTVLSENELPFETDGNQLSITGRFTAGTNTVYKLRVYLNAMPDTGKCPLAVSFRTDDSAKTYTGSYTVTASENERYAEISYPNKADVYTEIFIEPENAAEVERVTSVAYARNSTDENVNVTFFGYNTIEAKTNASTEGYLTILQSQYPGWNAYVDGERVDVETVNGCYMGIKLTPGEHSITMKFRPVDFFVGVGVCAVFYVSLAAVFVAWSVRYCKEKRAEAGQQIAE